MDGDLGIWPFFFFRRAASHSLSPPYFPPPLLVPPALSLPPLPPRKAGGNVDAFWGKQKEKRKEGLLLVNALRCEGEERTDMEGEERKDM
jgi:hypothetical protein